MLTTWLWLLGAIGILYLVKVAVVRMPRLMERRSRTAFLILVTSVILVIGLTGLFLKYGEDFFESLMKESGDMTFRQQLTITLIDKAIIGIILVIVGFTFNRMLESFKAQQMTLIETLKSQETRKNEIARERRAAIAEFAMKLSVGFHIMAWLTWKAKHEPTGFSKKDITTYDAEMRALFPQIVGTRVVVAAVASDSHTQLGQLARTLYSLDEEVAKVCVRYKGAQEGSKDADDAREAIAELYTRIIDQDKSFIQEVAAIAGIQQDGLGVMAR
jgi:hypothetical protein